MGHILPTYYFSGEYETLYPDLLTLEHTEKVFHKGDFLWTIGEPITTVYYFRSGIAETYVEHEKGHRKILSFHRRISQLSIGPVVSSYLIAAKFTLPLKKKVK